MGELGREETETWTDETLVKMVAGTAEGEKTDNLRFTETGTIR